MKLPPTARRLLAEAAESKIGPITPKGGAEWEGRTRERVARILLARDLFQRYPHDNELEITEAGRKALAEITG